MVARAVAAAARVMAVAGWAATSAMDRAEAWEATTRLAVARARAAEARVTAAAGWAAAWAATTAAAPARAVNYEEPTRTCRLPRCSLLLGCILLSGGVGGAAALELVVHCSPCTLLPEGAVETFAQCTADWRRRVKRESGPRRASRTCVVVAGWIVKDKNVPSRSKNIQTTELGLSHHNTTPLKCA